MFKHFIAIAVLSLCLPLSGLAQDDSPITIDPDRDLPHYGTAQPTSYTLPIRAGVTSRQVIRASGASVLRLHFDVSPSCAGPWRLQVFDNDNRKIWSYSPAPDSRCDFWSDLLPSDVAVVEVTGGQGVHDLRLMIDKVVDAQKPTISQSPTVNQLKPIGQASENIQAWGKSVARLVFLRNASRQMLCTGFLVAEDLLLTNNHCISTEPEMASGLAEFDYDREGAAPVTIRFKEILITDRNLDFTLLRLETKSGRKPLTLDGGKLQEARPLVIIQHPAGWPKQVSIANCKIIGASLTGVTKTRTDFGHGCDTLHGSSGSPVLDFQSGKVVGLHHWGFVSPTRKVNRAVQIKMILPLLKDKNALKDGAARRALGFRSR